MIPDYYVRLVCLCCASFFLVHTAVGAGVLLVAPAAYRRAQGMPARSAAGLLLSLRLLPFVVASCAIVALCLPSYLWFEPRGGAEPLGMVCTAAAILGALMWVLAGVRSLEALVHTVRFEGRCRNAGGEARLDGWTSPLLVVDAQTPLLALSGVLRPKLFLTRAVYEALGPEELSAALRHEDAHRNSRDNLKRLALLLVPEILPFARSFTALERNWAMYSEWAADDEAAGGDAQGALWLASALVRVARMGTACGPELAASLTACGCGLEARVERLLRAESPREAVRGRGRIARHRELLLAGAFTSGIVLLPGALACVHGLLERLVQ